ncbi:FadR/GntR family transcriptional regulator [Parapusillimonas granuli]|uniref:FadR family transcriptional regulator n=1 Tax=Parapusillimonas granuli TaxID=380911 RepID=A0A853G1N8_9BURK|nr:FadR/GntR family transcriptional regulator [Parapusillimonas granuli]MBB5215919.1 GntR family transcriptional repressor for pyruvate dehydrogenase complex [Parapusillimonas granuli]MEB2399390.1 FadR/GntR family transcriptional regulator [Alcaligenaceae bacterium]NYT50783.1 FadR family transcriptional regulator [Parapusillimonas granuli]
MSKFPVTVVKNIAQQLQARIQRKDWAATGKLPGQRQLAEEMGVSRASLREAITMLEGLGLLRSEAGRGVFIAEPGEAGLGSAYGRWPFQGRYPLRDVYLVRAQLEELAAMLAASVVTESGLERLRDTVRLMQAAADVGDLVSMAEGDHAFHACMFELAGSPLLLDILAGIEDVVEGSRQVAFANPARVNEPIHEHMLIIEALATGSPEKAGLAMRHHLNNVADRSGVRLGIQNGAADPASLC